MHPDVATMDTILITIRDYALSSFVTPLVIKRPMNQANNFELKTINFQLLQGIQFHGLTHEDLNAHILNLLKVCDMVKYN